MSARGYHRHFGRSHKLYRDTENGCLLGVCAGIANYFDLRVGAVRILTVILALFMFWPVVIGYCLAGFLLRTRPLCYCGNGDERGFWREARYERHEYR